MQADNYTDTERTLIAMFESTAEAWEQAQQVVLTIGRQRTEIVRLLAKNHSYREVGSMLHISPARVGQMVNTRIGPNGIPTA